MLNLLSRTGVARRAFTAEVICERLLRNVHRLAQQNEQVSSAFLYSRPIRSVQHRNSPSQIMVRKLRFPLREEGRGSSAEAFLRGRACGSSSFQSPWLSTCKSNQRCVIPTTYNTHNHNLEALNEATKMLSEACLLGALGPFMQVIRKTSPSTRRSRKLHGNLKVNTGSIPIPLLPKSFLHSYMGKPQ